MITDAFDKSEVLFGPKDFYGEKKNLCDKCVIIFSEVIFEYMLETYEHEQAGIIRCCNGVTAVYVFEIDEMKIADGTVEAISNSAKRVYGVQFHPEQMNNDAGNRCMKQFVAICTN